MHQKINSLATSCNASGQYSVFCPLTGEKWHGRAVADPVKTLRSLLAWLAPRVESPYVFVTQEFPQLVDVCVVALTPTVKRALIVKILSA